MTWAEASVRTDSAGAEAVATAMLDAGSHGTATLPADRDGRVTVVGYFPIDDRLDDRLAAVRAMLRRMRAAGLPVPVRPRLTLRRLQAEEWATAWRAYFRPRRVGRRLVVAPPWEPIALAVNDVLLVIDPGQAFGTGAHPTTQLCLAALERWLRPGDHVLDWGTGTGILAIAAAKLGAASVVALDVDPVAVAAAWQNAELNGVTDRLDVREGDLDRVPPTAGFDLIVANIVAEVIAPAAHRLAERLRLGGLLVTGGIVASGAWPVEAALGEAGFAPVATTTEDEWVTTVYRRVPA